MEKPAVVEGAGVVAVEEVLADAFYAGDVAEAVELLLRDHQVLLSARVAREGVGSALAAGEDIWVGAA